MSGVWGKMLTLPPPPPPSCIRLLICFLDVTEYYAGSCVVAERSYRRFHWEMPRGEGLPCRGYQRGSPTIQIAAYVIYAQLLEIVKSNKNVRMDY